MNIAGKTIERLTRDPESEALRLDFTDGSAATFEVDGFRLIRVVPEYPTAADKLLSDFMAERPAVPLRYMRAPGRPFGFSGLQWHDGTEWHTVPVVEVDE